MRLVSVGSWCYSSPYAGATGGVQGIPAMGKLGDMAVAEFIGVRKAVIDIVTVTAATSEGRSRGDELGAEDGGERQDRGATAGSA